MNPFKILSWLFRRKPKEYKEPVKENKKPELIFVNNNEELTKKVEEIKGEEDGPTGNTPRDSV